MEGSAALAAYVLAPPAWRPPLHRDADLGYPGVHAPGNVVLTPNAMQHGFTTPPMVANECASVHEQVYDRLARPPTLALLNALFDGVREARRGAYPGTIDAPAFQLPPRVTLNDSKLEMYVRALADPTIALGKLARSVPYGFRGERILTMLWHGDGNQSVAVPRALWFIHAVGANESQLGRRTVAQYTQEWTSTVLTWATEQIHALPSSEEEHWVKKWSYSLTLIHAMRADGLIDEYAYLAWIVAQLHEVQTNARVCLLQLAEGALPAILGRAALAIGLLGALTAPGRPPWLAAHESALVAKSYELEPDAFVGVHLARIPCAVPQAARSDVLASALAPLLCTPVETPAFDACAIHLLDTSRDDMHTLFLRYFLPPGAPPDVEHRIWLLLTWACTQERDAPGRIYLAAALLQHVHECQAGRLILRDGRRVACTWTPFTLFDVIARWVDTVDGVQGGHACPMGNVLRAVSTTDMARLLGALCRLELFSFARFLQRLYARGILRSGPDTQRTQRHRQGLHARVFRAMPVHHVSENIRTQRRVAIYGARSAESYEEATERRAVREMAKACTVLGHDDVASGTPLGTRPSPAVSPRLHAAPLSAPPPPELALPSEAYDSTSIADAFGLQSAMPHLYIASPYVQERVLARLLPALQDDAVRAPSADEFARLATVLTSLDAMPALGEVCISLLDRHVETPCVVSVCHTVTAHARVFCALRLSNALAERLAPYAVHDASASMGMRVVPAQGRTMAVQAARVALAAMANEPPPTLPEAQAPSADALSASQGPTAALFAAHGLDAASEALLAAVPLAEAPGAVWHHALAFLSAPHAVPPPPAVVGYIAALAGAAGVRLPISAWMRDAYALHGGAPRAQSSAWTGLVAGLLRYGHVDADEVLRVLCAFAPHATPQDAHFEPCLALSDALLCTTSVPHSPCSLPVLGAGAWYDLSLLRYHYVHTDALLPWLLAVRTAPPLQTSLAPHTKWLQTQWHTHPAAFVRGAVHAPADEVLAIVREYDPETVPCNPKDATSVAQALAKAGPWAGTWALAELHCVLAGAPHAELEGLAEALLDVLLPPAAACAGAPLDELLTMGVPDGFLERLAAAALRRWVKGVPNAVHALARLAQTCTSPLACDAAPEAMRRVHAGLERDAEAVRAAKPESAADGAANPPVLPAARSDTPDTPLLLEHLAVLLFLLRTTFCTGDAPQLIELLAPLLTLAEDALHDPAPLAGSSEPLWTLLADVIAQVQHAAQPHALEAWLRTSPAAAAPLARLVRCTDPTTALAEAWSRLDAVLVPPPPPSRDPWAWPLQNGAPLPLEAVHTRKTRDTELHTAARAAPAPWLSSEQTYGDQDSVPLGASARRAKRRRPSLSPVQEKRMRPL
ncbi:RNA polymerase II mediator complex subunit [Malassezia japonica]|uniref:Mediator of RNA polymerase II transcription subunit 12 n=1 Tax=Malassezia japonica TaxID=223818 RepID=A0AAF0JA90_9BASI|nr:RNA polymerase II mediator complex subunit [Malassezia japonica]WFD39552.1 RNA polymerase II mediator complex subunit [Malassezia japonica]